MELKVEIKPENRMHVWCFRVWCIVQHPQQTGWLGMQNDTHLSVGRCRISSMTMMHGNAFIAIDVRATDLKSLRQVIFEDFGTGLRMEK